MPRLSLELFKFWVALEFLELNVDLELIQWLTVLDFLRYLESFRFLLVS